VGFNITDQLLIRYFAFVRYWRKKMKVQQDCGSASAICRLKKRNDSIRMEVLGWSISFFVFLIRILNIYITTTNDEYSSK
jgi:hypothetical protein